MQPRLHKFNKDKRLMSASVWLKTMDRANLVRKYSKRYGVNKLSAVKELNLLGCNLSESSFLPRKSKIIDHQRDTLTENDCFPEFSYIAGYTSNGVPYGVLHEEE